MVRNVFVGAQVRAECSRPWSGGFWINVRHVPGNQRPKPKSICKVIRARDVPCVFNRPLSATTFIPEFRPKANRADFMDANFAELFMPGTQNEDDDNYDNYT